MATYTHDNSAGTHRSNAFDFFKSTEVRIDPLSNHMFTRVFGSKDSKNITKDLVNAIFLAVGIEPIDSITRIDAESSEMGGSIECRTARYDVLIESAFDDSAERPVKRYIDLESQGYNDYIGSRSMFYASRLLANRTPEGVSFNELPQVIVITLLHNMTLSPNNDQFINVAHMKWDWEHNGEGEAKAGIATDRVVFVAIELAKFKRRYNELDEEVLNDELLSWLYLLVEGYRHEREMRIMAAKIPSMEEFAEKYGISISDDEFLTKYYRFVDGFKEYASQQQYLEKVRREAANQAAAEGRMEGLEEGRAAGLEEGRAAGLEEGHAIGLEEGRAAGLEEGHAIGLEEGRAAGLEEGRAMGFEEGFTEAQNALAQRLKALGVDEDTIRKALDANG